ncbi:hypothetical protein Mapa_007630 [Marchantia paleacea]|nr:hypothetical protein Mapa_007630 [Marchantia paleacea]
MTPASIIQSHSLHTHVHPILQPPLSPAVSAVSCSLCFVTWSRSSSFVYIVQPSVFIYFPVMSDLHTFLNPSHPIPLQPRPALLACRLHPACCRRLWDDAAAAVVCTLDEKTRQTTRAEAEHTRGENQHVLLLLFPSPST